jgi:prefoldin beta subunit
MTQKQHLEIEQVETDKALEELKKAADNDNVYKYAGSIMIKSTKKELIDELEERKELAKTRAIVLEKQESRIKESLKEQEAKITEMMRSPSSGNIKTSSTVESDDNPRK